MKIAIIGSGVFGTFLAQELGAYAEISDDADIVIPAVPVSAYENVAEKYKGRHLVNVCSVQRVPNETCLRWSDRVTGIHPMFGPQSPVTNRSCIVTHTCAESKPVIDLFAKIGCEIVTHHNGKPITGADHDAMMRKTHLPVLMFGELAALIVEQAADVPDNCLPTSFKRLKALAEQMKDMSPGTVESIRSNL
ncbi:MAG: prephenate dehydrogenase/arogenate dehydrogenase family protein [Alphaproteobacteria bacterium]|nr:MAG: prephenate dehydrogenase/arogenate dehydrogenase family protein [Alphaproteobacteria bacterium]